jgi:hypothetical protein
MRKNAARIQTVFYQLSYTRFRFVHNNGIQSNRCNKSQCTVSKKENSPLTKVEKSNMDITHRLLGSFRSLSAVVGEKLYNFLLVWTAGYLGCSLSIEVARMCVRAVVQQKVNDVWVSFLLAFRRLV